MALLGNTIAMIFKARGHVLGVRFGKRFAVDSSLEAEKQ